MRESPSEHSFCSVFQCLRGLELDPEALCVKHQRRGNTEDVRHFAKVTGKSRKEGLRFCCAACLQPRRSQRAACDSHACSPAWQTNNSVIDAASAFVIYLPCFLFFLPPTELMRKVLLENHVSLLFFSLRPARCGSHYSSRFSRVSGIALFSTDTGP